MVITDNDGYWINNIPLILYNIYDYNEYIQSAEILLITKIIKFDNENDAMLSPLHSAYIIVGIKFHNVVHTII